MTPLRVRVQGDPTTGTGYRVEVVGGGVPVLPQTWCWSDSALCVVVVYSLCVVVVYHLCVVVVRCAGLPLVVEDVPGVWRLRLLRPGLRCLLLHQQGTTRLNWFR